MLPLYVLAAIGVYASVCWLYEHLYSSLLGIIWGSVKQIVCGQKTLGERYGKWAVVTGATDGIGKGYAVNLAKKGMNLVLISRSDAKLVKVSRELQDAYGVQIKRIVADFSAGAPIYSHIRKELAGIDIGILVNNVGIVPDSGLDLFENHPAEDYLRMVNVNIVSTLLMTHLVLPIMKKARRGMVINVSSSSAYFPAPFLSVYSATKVFGHNLSLALQQELRGTGVECQLAVPAFVRTNLTDGWNVTKYGGSMVPDANDYGRWATWMIGKTSHTCGHWFHSLQYLGSMLIPASLFRRAVYHIFGDLKKNPVQNTQRTTL
ncbi:hypothetical protein quinque_011807 [Culex quinquefasciatus]|uniref:hydroxysteroid dehydrogenase-like protein 1 n=1 Tax=Culex quinquefasciatus TaxID=7176 RepID=UPI0018E3CCCE|nr:hydroxysteroid dehydrogenase-like protein 1 [Culex quinquefasciatus]